VAGPLHLATLLLLLTAGLVGCRGEAPAGFDLRTALVSTEEAPAALELPAQGRWQEVTVEHQHRTALVLPSESWSWTGTVPESASLYAGVGPATGKGPVAASVTLWEGNQGTLLTAGAEDGEEAAWIDLEADLSAYAGKQVRLTFLAEVLSGSQGEVAWDPVVLRSQAPVSSASPERPPNIVLIVVDTLRHDHLSSYGYSRPTSPNIDRLLAQRGVVLENAYSQAPWTLPSVVSLLTGRYPTELLADEAAAFKIPDEVPVLSELLQGLGYETAAFYANPALHAGTGFGRGFETFFAPPADFGWFRRHADDLNRRMLPWVKARAGAGAGDRAQKPFFLYAHYLDPHDPYDNPDLVEGKSPYFPDYTGSITGHQVHRIYGGFDLLQDPEQDVAHLTALYDSEITYVDRFLGELLETLGPETLENTLVVLTSDHGEELFDHGGWKHGQSVYEEQIHVPLILRWDGHFPAGRRLEGTVELLDVLPTLISAAGGRQVEGVWDSRWQGHDLLPALRGEAALPRRAAFAQDLSVGPMRAAVVVDSQKLMLFNRHQDFEPQDPLQEHLWTKDLRRFEDAELYDLAADPGEHASLLPEKVDLAARLAPLIHHRLDRRLPGLRVLPSGIPQGSRLEARISFDRPPEGWDPYFLGDRDEATLDGSSLELRWQPTPGALPGRGFLVRGDFTELKVEKLTLDGVALPLDQVLLGHDRPLRGSEIRRRELKVTTRPEPLASPGLLLWEPEVDFSARAAEEDEETRKRLQALGYLLQ